MQKAAAGGQRLRPVARSRGLAVSRSCGLAVAMMTGLSRSLVCLNFRHLAETMAP